MNDKYYNSLLKSRCEKEKDDQMKTKSQKKVNEINLGAVFIKIYLSYYLRSFAKKFHNWQRMKIEDSFSSYPSYDNLFPHMESYDENIQIKRDTNLHFWRKLSCLI